MNLRRVWKGRIAKAVDGGAGGPAGAPDSPPPAAGWVVLRLRVRRGRVGFGACPRDRSLLSRTKSIAPSAEPQTVALRTPDLRHTTDIVVFNDGYIASEVDIFEAGILVQRAAAGKGAERQ